MQCCDMCAQAQATFASYLRPRVADASRRLRYCERIGCGSNFAQNQIKEKMRLKPKEDLLVVINLMHLLIKRFDM